MIPSAVIRSLARWCVQCATRPASSAGSPVKAARPAASRAIMSLAPSCGWRPVAVNAIVTPSE
ncbi:hypothetical protein LUX73_22965 [Actinomadura madurae]|nr:hypothetical protein [Actinomadura madurae]MCQ0007242.1 hypothetical protein [Actinomadura madurae]